MAERTILDVAKFLQNYGLTAKEHPDLPGGVGKGHSPTGYHPTGEAVDITDWRPDVAPAFPGGKPIHWKQRTGELSWRAKQLGIFSEALGPGDKGHDTHVHLALPGRKFITDQQLEWLATGRSPEGKLTDVMPGFQGSLPAASQQSPQVPPSQQIAQQLPQDINIFIDSSMLGKKEEEKATREDFLKQYALDRFAVQPSNVMGNIGAFLMQTPKKNYFA